MDYKERMNDGEEALRLFVESMLAASWHALPCTVQAVAFTGAKRMTITAQPTVRVRVRQADGTLKFVQLPLLVDVPVVFPGGGGFTLTFPLAQGDECLVVFADRCIDGWWQSGGVQNPPEIRLHDLSDGFAIPGLRSKPRAVDYSSDHAALRNDDDTVHVALSGDTVHVTAPHVKVHGGLSYQWDVQGYGEKVTWLGGNNYQIDNYKTGAVVTTNNNPINPPEIP